jgi:beta-lactamase superfamily II metal-dependent hydrolase
MDAALTWLVKYQIRVLDAVIITHEHADAVSANIVRKTMLIKPHPDLWTR